MNKSKVTLLAIGGNEFRVVGEGSVTVIDGSRIKHSNLPDLKEGEIIGLFGVSVRILPAGYKYDLKKREPISPAMKKTAGK